jgi:hypothetical protein
VPFEGGLHRPDPELNFGFYVERISIRYKKPYPYPAKERLNKGLAHGEME